VHLLQRIVRQRGDPRRYPRRRHGTARESLIPTLGRASLGRRRREAAVGREGACQLGRTVRCRAVVAGASAASVGGGSEEAKKAEQSAQGEVGELGEGEAGVGEGAA
jgi:hypothetical protein